MDIITYPCCDSGLTMLVKEAPGDEDNDPHWKGPVFATPGLINCAINLVYQIIEHTNMANQHWRTRWVFQYPVSRLIVRCIKFTRLRMEVVVSL